MWSFLFDSGIGSGPVLAEFGLVTAENDDDCGEDKGCKDCQVNDLQIVLSPAHGAFQRIVRDGGGDLGAGMEEFGVQEGEQSGTGEQDEEHLDL